MSESHSTDPEKHSPLDEDGMDTNSEGGDTNKSPPLLEDVLQFTRRIGIHHDFIVEVVLAVCISKEKEIEEKNPIWIMLVGNPSSGKTLLVSLLEKFEDCLMIDVLTSNPFISGLSNKENPRDLLPTLDGKVYVVKDYTSFFGRSEETVKQLLSDLVSIYDGTFAKHSGARGTIRYKSSFSHIGCITPMGLNMRQRYMNMVGARFLTIRMPELTEKQREECFNVAWSKDLKRRFIEAHEAVCELLTSICETIRLDGVQLEPVSEDIRKELNLIAELVARARGEVKTSTQKFVTDDGEEKSYQELEDIQIEEPFRALHQLKALCRSLAILRGKEAVSAEEVATVRVVALSSMPVSRAEALSAFHTEPSMNAKEASDILGKNYKTVKRHLDQLAHLGVLHREKDTDGKTWIYEPKAKFRSLILPTHDV